MSLRVVLIGFLTLIVAVGCERSSTSNPPSASSSASAPESKSDAGRDPCGLLDPKEIEVALGPLAGPPFLVDTLNQKRARNADTCRYEFAGAQWIDLAPRWEGGASVMKLLGSAGALGTDKQKGQVPPGLLPEGVQTAGEWDEARVIGCCRIHALLGDAIVSIDFSNSITAPGAAVKLLNIALTRLEKPLNIRGRDGLESAEQREAQRPPERPACDLVSQTEAEAILGKPLVEAPKLVKSSCEYHVRIPDPKRGREAEVVAKVVAQWGYGYGALHELQQVRKGVGTSLGMELGGQTVDNNNPASWAKALDFGDFFAAVKNGVLVTVSVSSDGMTIPSPAARALAEKAASQL